MKYLLSLLLFFSSFFGIRAQNNFTLVKSIERPVDFISTDRLGNLYIVKNDFIWMYNNQGDSLAAFNSKKYGSISFVDATDPYQILVFFKDYNIILFLDNYLSENGDPIDLQSLGFDQVVMACKSRENGFWVFDQLKQKVFHLNDDFAITHETVNLIQWFGKAMMPNEMLEYNNKLYFNDYDQGLYIFDHFATYLKKVALEGLDHFQVLDNTLNYCKEESFCQYNFISFDTNCTALNLSPVKSARIEKNRFYLMSENKSLIYQTK